MAYIMASAVPGRVVLCRKVPTWIWRVVILRKIIKIMPWLGASTAGTGRHLIAHHCNFKLTSTHDMLGDCIGTHVDSRRISSWHSIKNIVNLACRHATVHALFHSHHFLLRFSLNGIRWLQWYGYSEPAKFLTEAPGTQ
jgi:hypothetical protein